MASLPTEILERSVSLPCGSVLAPKEFLHLGSRAAVDQAFCRLAKAGRLQRVARGLYISARGSETAPDASLVEAVVQSLSAMGKSQITVCGEVAAKSLGIVSEAGEPRIFFTSGRNKELAVGRTTVLLKRVPGWMTALGGSAAGDAVRALAWMGPEKAQVAAKALHTRLPDTQWASLSSIRASLPTWMAIAISKAPLATGVQLGSA